MGDAQKVDSPQSEHIHAVTRTTNSLLQVDEAFKAQPRSADIVYCVAGGNYNQNGFFVDLTAKDLEDCMRNNYFSAANAAKSMLDIWLAEDASVRKPATQKHRQIVFINSAAALLGLPGSIAYTSKCDFKCFYVVPFKDN